MVLTCISLMANNTEHLFLCLSAICMSSLEKFVFKSHFLIGLFVFFISESSCTFHTAAQGSALPLRGPGSLIGKWHLKTTIRVLRFLVAADSPVLCFSETVHLDLMLVLPVLTQDQPGVDLTSSNSHLNFLPPQH